jgi:sterol desaturase/sphingolipid hydroxylase (fatty acid hydroxylase superfamily)
MPHLDFENSRTVYRADFVFYGAVTMALFFLLVIAAPLPLWSWSLGVAGGLILWSLLEYLLHRFVLHRLEPFRTLHEQHHQRPHARIGTPTVISAPLFAVLLFLPAFGLLGLWSALALTTGVLAGYLLYAVTHHFCHHGYSNGSWFKRRLRWHGRHHAQSQATGCYGVSHGVWDEVFGTASASFRPAVMVPRQHR